MKNNHNVSVLIRVVCIAFVLLLSLEPVKALSGDPLAINGSFTREGYNNPIELSNLALTQWNPKTQVYENVTTLIPTQLYRISFTVSDLDGLDLLLLEVGLMLDEAFEDPDNTGIDDTFESAAGINAQGDQFDFIYNRSMTEPSLYVNGLYNEASSWELVSSNVALMQPEDFTHDFTFDFRVSKAAGVGAWALNVRVSDDYRDQPINQTIALKRLDGITMAWYGEIVSRSASDIQWHKLNSVTEYGSNSTNPKLTLTTIANGPYQRLISADAQWTGVKTDSTAMAYDESKLVASLVADPATQVSQRFAIRISESTLDILDPSTPFVQLSEAHQVLFASNTKTDEQGDTQDVYAYLKLSDQFQNGSYSGKLYFGVSN